MKRSTSTPGVYQCLVHTASIAFARYLIVGQRVVTLWQSSHYAAPFLSLKLTSSYSLFVHSSDEIYYCILVAANLQCDVQDDRIVDALMGLFADLQHREAGQVGGAVDPNPLREALTSAASNVSTGQSPQA